MKRRDFIKLSLVTSYAISQPNGLLAQDVEVEDVNFSPEIYNTNNAQLIVVYLYGGASQLAGNLTNLDEIKTKSQSDYDSYFRSITLTQNNCWQEAGGTYMEDMLATNDLTIFRSSFSEIREETNNKAHGKCTQEVQRGTFNLEDSGIVTNIAKILEHNGVIDENTILPFVTFEGESSFYAQGDKPSPSYLRAIALDKDLDNSYSRYDRYWYNYTSQERAISDYSSADNGFDPAFSTTMDRVAQANNTHPKIKEAFDKRKPLSDFIDDIASEITPDLGNDNYIVGDEFAQKMESAVKVLAHNPDTKIITLNTGGLGGWDDHDDARNYVVRAEKLFKTLKSGMSHIKAISKENNVSIMVFGEFGRNVNLNSAFGWDHGNLQNFYVMGGHDYFNHKGIVGETIVDDSGLINRLYLKPKENTYSFEHISIASTIYKIFGITNPEILTSVSEIEEIFT